MTEISADMTGRNWSDLFGLLRKFFTEEAREPEHAEDAILAQTAANAGIPAAASMLIAAPTGRVLFVRRGDEEENFPGHWAWPGGKVDAEDSDALAAARRECGEEIGQDCSAYDCVTVDQKRTARGWDHTTFACVVPEEFEPKLNGEHSEHAWATLDDPPSPLHPGVAATIRDLPGKLQAEDAESSLADLRAALRGPSSMATKPGYVARDAAEGERHALVIEFTELEDLQALLNLLRYAWYCGTIGHSMMIEADRKGFQPEGPFTERPKFYMDGDGSDRIERILLDGEDVTEPDGAKDARLAMDPLTDKGQKILAAMKEQYGEEKGEQVFYASRNKGTIEGVDRAMDAAPTHRELRFDRAPAVAMDWRGVAEFVDKQGPAGLAFDRDSVRALDTDGRLHVERSHISKATVNPYYGWEIPGHEELGLERERVYWLLRDPEELEKAASTFNKLPILSTHREIDADNHPHDLVIGSTGESASFRDGYLDNSLVFWPREAIRDIEGGTKKELSCAYHYVPDMTPGTYEGKHYDGVMRNIRGNHLALVSDGRAGSDVVVMDAAPVHRALRF